MNNQIFNLMFRTAAECDAWAGQQWDQGNILIQTTTVPSKEPIVTTAPRDSFIEILEVVSGGRRTLHVDAMLEHIKHSVLTEGQDLHYHLVVAMGYSMTLSPQDAHEMREATGIISQHIWVEVLADGKLGRGTLPASMVRPYLHHANLLAAVLPEPPHETQSDH